MCFIFLRFSFTHYIRKIQLKRQRHAKYCCSCFFFDTLRNCRFKLYLHTLLWLKFTYGNWFVSCLLLLICWLFVLFVLLCILLCIFDNNNECLTCVLYVNGTFDLFPFIAVDRKRFRQRVHLCSFYGHISRTLRIP